MKIISLLSIKRRLILNAAIVTIGMFLIASLTMTELDSSHKLGQTASDTEKLAAKSLTLRRNEKDFLARLDLKYIDQFNNNVEALKSDIATVRNELDKQQIATKELNLFEESVTKYAEKFNLLVEQQKIIGLNSKDGLYGGLRNSIHEVEDLLSQENADRLLVDMLQLRRNEKDFMLRRDLKYLEKFDQNLEVFKSHIKEQDFDANFTIGLSDKLDQYLLQFKALVEAEKNIGLDHKSGMLGDLRKTIHQSEEQTKLLTQSINEVIAEKRKATTKNLLLAFSFIAFISLGTLFLTSHSIVKPITKAVTAIRNIRKNNDLTVEIQSTGRDELSELTRDMNSLTHDFRNLVSNAFEAMENLEQVSKSLADNTQSTSQHLEQQRTESDMVATAATEMQASIQEVSSNTHLAAEKAGSTNSTALEGKQEVSTTVQRIKSLSEQISEATDLVSELEKDSQTIGSVLDVIRGIAEQTNLLALNAAIEAARAGEQGRGFAVVADEVRNLAMRTQESTQEIESIISTLQSRTGSIVSNMDQCRNEGLQSAEQIIHAGEILESITDDVTNIMDMNTQIATAVEEQSAVAEEIGRNVVRIRDLAEASSIDGQNNSQQSQQVSLLASKLHAEILKYKI